MKLDAHPLVVAVALGLLGPGALASEEDEDSRAEACCPPSPDHDAFGDEPDTDEIARVEREWATIRAGS
jgi:hypothetical protein